MLRERSINQTTVDILKTLGFPKVCFKNDLSRLVGEKLQTQILSLLRQQVSVETRKRKFDLESHFEREDFSLSLPVTFNNSASATYVVFKHSALFFSRDLSNNVKYCVEINVTCDCVCWLCSFVSRFLH